MLMENFSNEETVVDELISCIKNLIRKPSYLPKINPNVIGTLLRILQDPKHQRS
jgi:hypothetical protein